MKPPTRPLHNPTKTATLTYIGTATMARHGAKGVRYRHESTAGAKDLIFQSHLQAGKWLNPLGGPK